MGKLRSFMDEYVVLIILALFMIIASFFSDKFFTVMNITNVFRQVSMVVIVGSAVNLLMISGGIDLSVGSIMALSSITLAKLVAEGRDFSFILAIIVALLVGLACGALNAFLVVNLSIIPIIATLGTLYIFRGMTYLVCDGLTIGSGFPSNYTLIGQGLIFKIPIPVIIAFLIFMIFFITQSKTIFGRYIFVIGGDEQVAKLSGISVPSIKFILYTLVGLASGIAGIILTSRANSAGPNFGLGFEFDVILAVLIGGTKIGGGKGDVKGMFFGALVIGVLSNGMNLIGIGVALRRVIAGVVFVIAIIIYKLIRGEKILDLFE